jgi:GH25 family lysozyme M1 (1,4-beta-N-acetylmuramidase)
MLKGIDVSDVNGNVDWIKAKQDGIAWAGVKATEGQDWASKTFTGARVKAMRKVGIEFTPYHYLRFRRDRTGDVEAKHCLEVCLAAGWKPGEDLPITVDAEWIGNEAELRAMSGAQAREYVSDFAEYMAKTKRAGKRGCITYLSPSFTSELGNRAPRSAGVAWVAAWDATDGKPPTPPGFQRSLVRFHQTSDKGHKGYVESGVVDLDVFMGSGKDMRVLIRGHQLPAPKPVAHQTHHERLAILKQQHMLRAIGWPIKADGVTGPQTKGALMDFQGGMAASPKRLVRDGVCGVETARWLKWSVAHGGACSPHFKYREFASSHTGWIKIERDLILGLEKLRAKLGHPIGILSGYRDFALGASNSQHRYGNAADPKGSFGSIDLVRSVRAFSGIGYQAGDKHVRHVDVRHRGPNFTGGTITNPTIFIDAF